MKLKKKKNKFGIKFARRARKKIKATKQVGYVSHAFLPDVR